MIKQFLLSKLQYLISIALIILTSSICFVSVEIIGYKVVALILLVVVSMLAMLFNIKAVMLAAFLSALIWNFFFIPPLFTFHISDTEDTLMFLMYFLIALVNAVLTNKIRVAEKKAWDKEEKVKTIKLYNTILNSLSHELRTPISTIIGSIDTLKENREKISVENQEALMAEIENASTRLNQQVENLLNMSRLESGHIKLNLDWYDSSDIVNLVIQRLPKIKTQHNIIFNPKENLPLFKLDAGFIEHILYNIMHNALQYTPVNSIIKVEVEYKNRLMEITIEDNGKGFPESEIQYVFDKFYRLPQTITGGTGLGLSIAKGFTEAHGGTIKLENTLHGGARFIITIPTEITFISDLKNE